MLEESVLAVFLKARANLPQALGVDSLAVPSDQVVWPFDLLMQCLLYGAEHFHLCYGIANGILKDRSPLRSLEETKVDLT